ncbi:MAG TPA: OsmC family protein [Candidatus Limnocylindria bacterium]
MSTISVLHDTGDRFRIKIRDHEVVVDQPGSGDTGPTPTELFVASLVSCAAFYARRFLARRGVGDGELIVSGDFMWADDHTRVTAVAIRVETARGIPEELHAALARVVEHCTVHESIARHIEVSWDFAARPLESEVAGD